MNYEHGKAYKLISKIDPTSIYYILVINITSEEIWDITYHMSYGEFDDGLMVAKWQRSGYDLQYKAEEL